MPIQDHEQASVDQIMITLPVRDLDDHFKLLCQGLDFDPICDDRTGEGFIVGHPDLCPNAYISLKQVAPQSFVGPSPEVLTVFYLNNKKSANAACERLQQLGFSLVKPNNIYWEKRGYTFATTDSFQYVIMSEPYRDQAVRFARPARNFGVVLNFYTQNFGFVKTSEFTNHDGFDGLIFGLPCSLAEFLTRALRNLTTTEL